MPMIHIHEWDLRRQPHRWLCLECDKDRGITISETRAVLQDFIDARKKR